MLPYKMLPYDTQSYYNAQMGAHMESKTARRH